MVTTTVLESERFPREELRIALERICERAQEQFPGMKLVIGEDFNDVEDPNTHDNNGRFWIETKKKVLLLYSHDAYLLTAYKQFSSKKRYNCAVQHPAIFQIAKDEMEQFCAEVGVENLTLKKYF